ncbi:hypothetical protein AOLI_G00311600 [Acnodon oligacanthus]
MPKQRAFKRESGGEGRVDEKKREDVHYRGHGAEASASKQPRTEVIVGNALIFGRLCHCHIFRTIQDCSTGL